jgi:hypothetical protein
MRARGQGRRDMPQRLTARGTEFRVDNFRAKPTASFFTPWVYTLNCRARHQGHNILPQQLRVPRGVEPLTQQKSV